MTTAAPLPTARPPPPAAATSPPAGTALVVTGIPSPIKECQ